MWLANRSSFDKKSHSFIYHISLEIPMTQTVFWKVTKQVQDNLSDVHALPLQWRETGSKPVKEEGWEGVREDEKGRKVGGILGGEV